MLATTTTTATKPDNPFNNGILSRIGSKLTEAQVLGFHALLNDLEKSAGRSGCTLAKLGEPSHRGVSTGVNIWHNKHFASYSRVTSMLREHERKVLRIILEAIDHRKEQDLAEIGQNLTGYKESRAASAAFISRCQALGSTLFELYQARIRAP